MSTSAFPKSATAISASRKSAYLIKKVIDEGKCIGGALFGALKKYSHKGALKKMERKCISYF
jgi:hypothetical protein